MSHPRYDDMDILADFFNEGPRMAARQRSQARSPREHWADPAWVVHLMESGALQAAIDQTDRPCPYGARFSDGLTPYTLREVSAVHCQMLYVCFAISACLDLSVR